MHYEDDTAVIEDVTATGHWIPPNVPNWLVLFLAASVTLLGLLGVLTVDPSPLSTATVVFLAAAAIMAPGWLRITHHSVRVARHPLARSFPLGSIVGFRYARPRLAPYDQYYLMLEGDPRPRFLFNSGTPGYEQILLHLLERTGLHQFDPASGSSPRAWAMLALTAFAGIQVLLHGGAYLADLANLLAHSPVPR